MFIVLLTYTAPIDQLDACLDEHRALLAEGIASGVLMCAGRKVPRTGGAMLLKTETRAEAEAYLARDPFKSKGLATYEVIEFQPTVMSPAFEALLR